MDKTGEYLNISRWIEDTLQDVSSQLLTIRDELCPVLEKELQNAVSTTTSVPNGTTSEVLREYIKTSREIQKVLFDKISTHVLTIERLADHILCRRAAKIRSGKTAAAVTQIKQQSSPDIAIRLAEMMKGMSLQQQEEFLKKFE